MPRVAFSIRFPAKLAEALDRIAQRRGLSRSDLVETMIRGMDAEDREAIVKTTVIGAPTDKRNLRLSADALQHLKQLAGDLEPSDFLRRTIASLATMVPAEWLHDAAPSGNGRAASSRRRRGPHAGHAPVEDVDVVETAGAAAALVPVAIVLAIGAFVWFIVWLTSRLSEWPSPDAGTDHPGQLPGGTAAPGGA